MSEQPKCPKCTIELYYHDPNQCKQRAADLQSQRLEAARESGRTVAELQERIAEMERKLAALDDRLDRMKRDRSPEVESY